MNSIRAESHFSSLSLISLDPTYALKELFYLDTHPKKVILGAGVYRDDNSKPLVLNVVKKAEELVHSAEDSSRYEYLPITGYQQFYTAARDLLFGTLKIDPNCIISVQTISGTGANHIGARFLADTLRPSAVWISDPSWVNHENIWRLVGVQPKLYPYWNNKTKTLDFDAMVLKLESEAITGDVIILHACAHNPTGIDPSMGQWAKIADICEKKGLFPFFDSAYQGFASSDLDKDVWSIRHFVSRGTLEVAVAQSFSKNLGLYGERVGAFHLMTKSPDAAARSKSQITRLQRGEISQPPATGSRIAATILNSPELFEQWLQDLKTMSSRIKSMRKALFDELTSLGTPGNWDHIVLQAGMFSYTGLTEAQVAGIQNDHHVYMLTSGRISIAGLNTKNFAYVTHAIDSAVRKYH
ncbi:aspartate aminotransferase [Stipitochalara longipes BDJ]|nr:aspartate aminotransferase [Stipitochalara longipes BDJ]